MIQGISRCNRSVSCNPIYKLNFHSLGGLSDALRICTKSGGSNQKQILHQEYPRPVQPGVNKGWKTTAHVQRVTALDAGTSPN